MSAKVPNPHNLEGAARITLSAALDTAGPSWADLADAIENGTNYENDAINVSIALKAVMTALESDRFDADEVQA